MHQLPQGPDGFRRLAHHVADQPGDVPLRQRAHRKFPDCGPRLADLRQRARQGGDALTSLSR